MKYSMLYVAAIAAVNVLFVTVPMVPTPWGPWSVGTLLVGAVFILRDRADLELGRWRVLLASALGVLLSYLLADPFVATASAVAFAAGEFVDWAVFRLLEGRPLRDRVVASSLLGVPVDTVVFLKVLGGLNAPMLAVGVVSKLAALAFVLRGSDADHP